MNVAKLGNAILLDTSEAPTSGGFFPLNRPPRFDLVLDLPGGYEIEARAKDPVLIVRGGVVTSPDEAMSESLERAQQGLDILSVQGKEHLSISTHLGNQHYGVWWLEPEGPAFRLVSHTVMGFDMSINIAKYRDGIEVPDPPLPPAVWHSSYRYFRLSQSTHDSFEAYRNLFLALESILSDLVPPRLRPGGRVGEGESEWFRRALHKVSELIDLVEFVPPDSNNPVEALYNDLYRDRRNALFHAKKNRHSYLPLDPMAHQPVFASIEHLRRLYLALTEKAYRIEHRTRAVTVQGFRLMMAPLVEQCDMFLSDDTGKLTRSDTKLNPDGGAVLHLVQSTKPFFREPFMISALGSCSGSDLAHLASIRKYGLSFGTDKHLMVEGSLMPPLHPLGFQRVEWQMKLEMRQHKAPIGPYQP